ncbi:MAG: glycosyltransferase family 2 protein [Muribaculaceae bacterium]
MSCPRFSFVLPAYKGRYLAESIQSILTQTITDFELVIVNDCSPDDIAAIVAVNSDERIRYYENEQNIGGTDLVAQWNKCLSYARGEYVILATDDDLYEPNFLETFVPLIEKYPMTDLFHARILTFNGNGIIRIDFDYKEYMTFVDFLNRIVGFNWISGIPHYIFRSEVLRNNGGFVNLPLAWGSDAATAIMMSRNGVVSSQEILVRFRYSDINISSQNEYQLVKRKVVAFLQYLKWLDGIMVSLPVAKGDVEEFNLKYCRTNYRVYRKMLVVQMIRAAARWRRLILMSMVVKSGLYTTRDIGSMLYRIIKR